jgi:hypothetical protein
VPHLRILDGDSTIFGDALANPRRGSARVARIWFEILLDDLTQGRDLLLKRRTVDLLWQVLGDPLFETCELRKECRDRFGFLVGIAPVQIEPLLDTGLEK